MSFSICEIQNVMFFLGGFLFGEDGEESKQLDVIISTDTAPRYDFRNPQGKGKSFGIVVVKYGGNDFEVAQFRNDGTYLDGRRPESVQITGKFKEDVERRDFTINAMGISKAMMEKVAIRHKMRVLLHEKPFAGVNGSGKHNNWSLGTNTGKNLLSPGKTPKTNMQFLTFFVNTVKAVYEHADLLRASIASANNDHRLGAIGRRE